MNISPVIWAWDGEAMRPHSRFNRIVNAELVVGETYRLAPVEERSEASHNQYFAALHDKWMSLPDALAMDFPNEQILRKYALCMTGFRHERKFACSSPEEARKLAAWLKPRFMGEGNYAIISVAENVVVEWTPVSQSKKAMPEKGRFQQSKEAVLNYIDDLLGIGKDDKLASPPRSNDDPPSVLTDADRALLRKLAARLNELRFVRDLDTGQAALIDKHTIVPGSPLDLAARSLFDAHRKRVRGETSPAETDIEVQRVLG